MLAPSSRNLWNSRWVYHLVASHYTTGGARLTMVASLHTHPQLRIAIQPTPERRFALSTMYYRQVLLLVALLVSWLLVDSQTARGAPRSQEISVTHTVTAGNVITNASGVSVDNADAPGSPLEQLNISVTLVAPITVSVGVPVGAVLPPTSPISIYLTLVNTGTWLAQADAPVANDAQVMWWPQSLAEWGDTAFAILSSLGILAAGFWAVMVYGIGRSFTSNMQVRIQLKQVLDLGPARNRVFVAEVTAKNIGQTDVLLDKGYVNSRPLEDVITVTKGYFLSPQPFSEVRWIDDSFGQAIFVDQNSIEPGEEIVEDVLIPASTSEQVAVMVHLYNQKPIFRQKKEWYVIALLDSKSLSATTQESMPARTHMPRKVSTRKGRR